MSKFINNVKALVGPFLSDSGYELFDIEYLKTQMGMTLIIYVDNVLNNITIDECVSLDEKITVILKNNDLLPDVLSISSPGLDRALKTEKDFARNINKLVDISLYTSTCDEKKFTAKLLEYNENNITISYKNKNHILERKNIANIKQAVVF